MAGWGRTAGPGLFSPTTFAAAHGPGPGGGGADPTPPAAQRKDEYVSDSESNYDSPSESQPLVLLRNGRLFVHQDCKLPLCYLPQDCQWAAHTISTRALVKFSKDTLPDFKETNKYI